MGSRTFKRVMVVGDTHCGHRSGLTHPRYQHGDSFEEGRTKLWKWFAECVEKIKPVDCLILNGDMIDGDGRKANGTEQLTTDRIEQVQMAYDAVQWIGAGETIMTYGTPYHVGAAEGYEELLADKLGAAIKARWLYQVNDTVFDVKHHPASSGTLEHTKGNFGGKDRLLNKLGVVDHGEAFAHVIIRNHVHKNVCVYDDTQATVTMPCLQLESKFGSVRCHGYVKVGFAFFDVYPNQGVTLPQWRMAKINGPLELVRASI